MKGVSKLILVEIPLHWIRPRAALRPRSFVLLSGFMNEFSRRTRAAHEAEGVLPLLSADVSANDLSTSTTRLPCVLGGSLLFNRDMSPTLIPLKPVDRHSCTP